MEFIEVYTFMICTHLHAHTQQLNHKSKDRRKKWKKKRKMENDEGESHLDVIWVLNKECRMYGHDKCLLLWTKKMSSQI